MNIQRKYSLPNCTLLLEGLSDSSRAAHYQDMRPELSILVNAECYLSGLSKPLVGGREFFESLVRAVSGYAQLFLSNVPNFQVSNQNSEIVQIHKVDPNCHRLVMHPETEQDLNSNLQTTPEPVETDLNTVQLFDLVEAIDQFFADSQTLPELTLQLQSVSKHDSGISQGALIKQAVPATVGLSGLAAAAVVLSLIPVPSVKELQPQEQVSSKTETTNVTPSLAASDTPIPTVATSEPASVVPTPTVSASMVTAEAATATPSTTPVPTATGSPGVNANLESLLATVPEITDASQLRSLNRQVYNSINPAWTNRGSLPEDVVYRVGVAADGAIVGYKAVNKGANDVVDQTPLPGLLYNPATRATVANEPIAQYRVVFRKQGVLEVSPWNGYSQKPQIVGEKISEPNQVKDLSQKLYEQVRKDWGGTPTFKSDLKYRVAVNKDAVISDYEPLNQVAVDHSNETPLPKILKDIYGSNLKPPTSNEPLAHYQLVFKPNGTLEIQPWQGYQ
ncbi:DUF4335 domain-containing protein [Calothrix sp. PCC 6303]|uniref:DUF4335 domain-containing protein n=1 Tax=Calothrix sp. PCC 6303 TaxID=1170562 RepID=UPI0002A00892|nr:DUF4335 domain-containing protein [Calothrix sp. PCC 6303]AFZ00681.1 hypothetical protein Cal6303_1639 [Calothrix sp. PCC 6303]